MCENATQACTLYTEISDERQKGNAFANCEFRTKINGCMTNRYKKLKKGHFEQTVEKVAFALKDHIKLRYTCILSDSIGIGIGVGNGTKKPVNKFPK